MKTKGFGVLEAMTGTLFTCIPFEFLFEVIMTHKNNLCEAFKVISLNEGYHDAILNQSQKYFEMFQKVFCSKREFIKSLLLLTANQGFHQFTSFSAQIYARMGEGFD